MGQHFSHVHRRFPCSRSRQEFLHGFALGILIARCVGRCSRTRGGFRSITGLVAGVPLFISSSLVTSAWIAGLVLLLAFTLITVTISPAGFLLLRLRFRFLVLLLLLVGSWLRRSRIFRFLFEHHQNLLREIHAVSRAKALHDLKHHCSQSLERRTGHHR